jgi:hypothetical protein
MKWRKISDEEVVSTISRPEEIQDSIKGRKKRI